MKIQSKEVDQEMGSKARRVGPEGLLKANISWLHNQVTILTEGESLRQAASMLWNISLGIRARQGQLWLSFTSLASRTGIRRQTVTDVNMGTTWPDAATLARIYSIHGLEITATVTSSPSVRTRD